MVGIKVYEFNPIRVNTYVVYDKTGECVIVDPGCYGKEEEHELSSFIESKNLKPVRLLLTHAHTDHIMGVNYVINKYNLQPECHRKSQYFLENVKNWGAMLGFDMDDINSPIKEIKDGDIIKYGYSELEVVYTPGHADGSVCLINKQEKYVITGDVLFAGSIGRTDLPTGDFEILERSIKEKLYILPEDYTVYPGHRPSTTIGEESNTNPFIHL